MKNRKCSSNKFTFSERMSNDCPISAFHALKWILICQIGTFGMCIYDSMAGERCLLLQYIDLEEVVGCV